MSSRGGRAALALLAVLALAGGARAEPKIVAVLGSDIGPYREALDGLRRELGEDIPFFTLAHGEPDLPKSARVVVAFGNKAALRSYPANVPLVYALAPGTIVADPGAVKIAMEPDHAVLVDVLKRLQPGLKNLGLLWVSPRFKAYAKELQDAARPRGVALETAALESSADLPDELRRLDGRVDALWLVPDPLLVNATSLSVLVEFSRHNKVPLFVSTEGLLKEGATASIGPTFREIGRLAGVAARRAAGGEKQANKHYPIAVRVVISRTSAKEAGLELSEESLRSADKVLP